jgi:predicted site-specific integrase-resolvase
MPIQAEEVAMRAALYARVSTVDKRQDPEVQLRELREYAARRAFEVVVEFVDFASGHRNGRPECQQTFEAARKRRFDVLRAMRHDPSQARDQTRGYRHRCEPSRFGRSYSHGARALRRR